MGVVHLEGWGGDCLVQSLHAQQQAGESICLGGGRPAAEFPLLFGDCSSCVHPWSHWVSRAWWCQQPPLLNQLQFVNKTMVVYWWGEALLCLAPVGLLGWGRKGQWCKNLLWAGQPCSSSVLCQNDSSNNEKVFKHETAIVRL